MMAHSSIAAAQTGEVVACYGRRGLLDAGDGKLRVFMIKGRRLRVVCGDQVHWQQVPGDEAAVVTATAGRRNALERLDSHGRTEILAANLDRLLVVLAPEPSADFFLADRFLCAAELMGAAGGVVWNKSDLGMPEPVELEYYRQLGHPVLGVSALTGDGISALETLLGTGITMLAGQSGAGKSSLVNRLVDTAAVPVGEISTATGEGRHTTTVAVMYRLALGGSIIDSPGVREFAPLVGEAARVQWGFRDISCLNADCRFANCQHLREPGCAVKTAAETGLIPARRYESYRRLLAAANAAKQR